MTFDTAIWSIDIEKRQFPYNMVRFDGNSSIKFGSRAVRPMRTRSASAAGHSSLKTRTIPFFHCIFFTNREIYLCIHALKYVSFEGIEIGLFCYFFDDFCRSCLRVPKGGEFTMGQLKCFLLCRDWISFLYRFNHVMGKNCLNDYIGVGKFYVESSVFIRDWFISKNFKLWFKSYFKYKSLLKNLFFVRKTGNIYYNI